MIFLALAHSMTHFGRYNTWVMGRCKGIHWDRYSISGWKWKKLSSHLENIERFTARNFPIWVFRLLISRNISIKFSLSCHLNIEFHQTDLVQLEKLTPVVQMSVRFSCRLSKDVSSRRLKYYTKLDPNQKFSLKDSFVCGFFLNFTLFCAILVILWK